MVPKQWAAAGEQSVFQASRRPGAARLKTYRFTWLRSFDAPVIVRLDQVENGVLRLTAKKLSGKGGYDPGVVAAQVERNLSLEEERGFYRALARASDLKLSPVNCQSGSDGASWIMEANDRGAYRYVRRWTPRNGPIHDLGLLMLGLTGWRLDPVY